MNDLRQGLESSPKSAGLRAAATPAPHPGRSDFDRLMVPTYSPSTLVPVRGQGLWIEDQQGRRFLDFTSGISVTSLGHAHPEVVAALVEQAGRLWHVGNGYTHEPVLNLAQSLIEHTFAERVFFANSGAEANEAALKLARRYAHQRDPARSRIVSCEQSFHGRTLFTVSVGGQPKYSEDYAPLPPGITHVTFNDLAAARAAIGPDVCAMIVEPVQGEGGVTPATLEYLRGLREACDASGALLIFDEVQCGLARSGSLYAYMHYGVVPDILTTAKALGNGFPISAMLTRDDVAAGFDVGAHGTTFGGNPMACAVGFKVFSILSAPAFLVRVNQAAARLWHGLEKFVAQAGGPFNEVRGLGLMLGLVLKPQFAGRAKEFVRAAEAQGLMVLAAGGDVVRLLPALVVSDEEIDLALARIAATAAGFGEAS